MRAPDAAGHGRRRRRHPTTRRTQRVSGGVAEAGCRARTAVLNSYARAAARLLSSRGSGRSSIFLAAADAATASAMRQGVDVIYQAPLFDGKWLGYADFLLRVDSPSELGDFSYEVADTKLARTVKASAIIQMCSYAEQAARVQGRDPGVSFTSCSATCARSPTACATMRLITAHSKTVSRAPGSRSRCWQSRPAEHCELAGGRTLIQRRRRDDDHLSLVARIRQAQVIKPVQPASTPSSICHTR